MKALLTGGTGFLGRYLCELLREEGHEVRAIVRDRSPGVEQLRGVGVECLPGDLTDVASLTRAAEGVDVLFHVAALVSYVASAEKLWRVNVAGTRNVLQACRAAGVGRLVHVSTESVTLRNDHRVDEDEDAPIPTRFIDQYSRTKAVAEREVIAANGAALETVAVRAPWVWGARDTSVLKAMIFPIQSGMFVMAGDGTNRVTTGHVRNVASALLACAGSPAAPGRVYLCADDGRPTITEFLGGICAACDVRLPRRHVPYGLLYAAAYAAERLYRMGVKGAAILARPFVIHMGRTWTLSDARIRAELGWKPIVEVDAGMSGLAEWVRERGGVRAAIRSPF